MWRVEKVEMKGRVRRIECWMKSKRETKHGMRKEDR